MGGMLLNPYVFAAGGGGAGGFTQVGAIGVSGYWTLSYSGGTLYAMRQSAEPNGTGTIYRSTNGGVSWTQGASMTGTGSSYGFGMLALSSSIVIVQHRGSFYRSTNSGDSFSNILNTGGGQNNFFNISWDGTYGVCAGYDQNVYSNDSWVSATTMSKPFGYVMATSPLTNNSSNRFVHAGLGSSGSPASIWIASNTGASATGPISVTGNQNYTASNPATGFNAIVSAPEGDATFGVWYATYPSTSYTTANVTGMGTTRSGLPCIAPNGNIIVPMTNGVWRVNASNAPISITNITDIGATTSDYTNGYVYLIKNSGEVYRWSP